MMTSALATIAVRLGKLLFLLSPNRNAEMIGAALRRISFRLGRR
jgi:hypothetical protein